METLASGTFSNLNYWAVLVVALMSFFLGGLWYSPALFEGSWMNANGYTVEQVKDIQSRLGLAGFAATFAAYLVMSLALAMLLRITGTDNVRSGVTIAALVWLGFVAALSLTVNLFSTRSLAAWMIDAGYHLIALIVGGIVLTLWR